MLTWINKYLLYKTEDRGAGRTGHGKWKRMQREEWWDERTEGSHIDHTALVSLFVVLMVRVSQLEWMPQCLEGLWCPFYTHTCSTCTYSPCIQSVSLPADFRSVHPLALSQFSSLHRSTWLNRVIGLQWDQQSCWNNSPPYWCLICKAKQGWVWFGSDWEAKAKLKKIPVLV